MRLADALGDLVDVPQFFIWRLTWLPEKQKYEKTPCYPSGSHLIMDAANPKNWMAYQTAVAVLANLRSRNDGFQYTLGWWVTEEAGYWFLDLDEVMNAEGVLSDTANWFLQALPGAFTEFSSSGRGLHIVGSGHVPEHGCKNGQWPGLELYTEDRGIAFGLTDQAEGCADVDHSNAMAYIVPHFLPWIPLEQRGSGPRPEWRGPTDDAELLRRALQSQSVEGVFGNKATFRDLWEGNVAKLRIAFPQGEPYGESEADGALAMQLAFWTGCDAPRIERLMRQSALVRDKWDSPRRDTTYLGFTIARACSGVSRVLVDKEPPPPLTSTVDEAGKAASQNWIERIARAEEDELRNEVIPGIAADGTVGMLDRDRLAVMVKDRLKDFQIPVTITAARLMVACAKPASSEPVNPDALPFVSEHVYVRRSDTFFHVRSATELSRTSFQADFNRYMPTKQNGDKEDAARWSLERWGMPTVQDMMYVPKFDPLFTYQGRTFANLYTPESLPALEDYTAEGIEGIKTFATMLQAFCDHRQEVYGQLLAWLAYNVQNPGVKVRWAPILKGVPGDGKSIITSVLGAAMGERNVSSVGPAVVMNTGGFTDWAHGACVISMEELKMDGKQRYVIANAFKDNVTNSRITINRKGKGLLPIINISNFIAFTNFNDAVPLEENDRRWFVVFSPYSCALDCAVANNALTVKELGEKFDKVFSLCQQHPGQVRKWLTEMQIPAWFDPNGHAPDTPEKHEMRVSGEDEAHAIARQVIATGAYGVHPQVLSSACLTKAMKMVCMAEGIEIPKTSALSKMLGDLGYRAIKQQIKWRGIPHRVWVIGKIDNDSIREKLDSTVTSGELVTHSLPS